MNEDNPEMQNDEQLLVVFQAFTMDCMNRQYIGLTAITMTNIHKYLIINSYYQSTIRYGITLYCILVKTQ